MEFKTLQEFQVFDEQRFTKRIVFEQNAGLVFMLNFMPGQSLPAHTHPGAAVTLLVLEGGGLVSVDGKEREAVRGDMFG